MCTNIKQQNGRKTTNRRDRKREMEPVSQQQSEREIHAALDFPQIWEK